MISLHMELENKEPVFVIILTIRRVLIVFQTLWSRELSKIENETNFV